MELDLLSVQANEASSVIGSSLTKINNYGVVIGGFSSHSPSNCNLVIRFFHFPSLQWKSVIVSTNNHSNRYYHSSSLLGNKIYLFGGYSLPQNTLSSTILSISESRFGWKVNKVDISSGDVTDGNGINPSSLIALAGLSSNVVGKTNNEKIIIFGGASLNNQQYFNEVTMFSFPSATSSAELKVIPIDGVKPEPRAFHTSSVIGTNCCHLLIIGGQTENQQLLNDIWILDLNEIVNNDPNATAIAAAEAANTKGGKAKGGKDAIVRPPSGIWTKLSTDNLPFIPRCFHTTVISDFNVFIFGGISKKGPLAITEMMLFSLEEANGKFNLLTDSIKEITVPITTGNNSKIINEETIFSCSSLLLSSSDLSLKSDEVEEGVPLGIMIFGGSRSLMDSKRSNWNQIYNISYFLSLQIENPLMKALKEKIKSSNSHIPEISFQLTMKGNDSMKFLTRISYENNDLYIGEVHRSTAQEEEGKENAANISEDNGEQLLIGNPNTDTPNGFGKMVYANGDVYKVRLCFLLFLLPFYLSFRLFV
jgi:hypothetical protein